MAQHVKYPLSKHEDLGLGLQYPHKNNNNRLVQQDAYVAPELGVQASGQGDPQADLLIIESMSFRSSEKPCLKGR